jgi:membrane-associated phospholipid phosphatase
MRDMQPGESMENGVALGHAVAEKVLAWRAADGQGRRVAYRPRLGPGLWQPTPPRYKPALLPQWPRLACFAMRSGDQFRPSAPPPLDSAEYEAAYREVEALGGIDSRVRTREQTQIARFWADGDGTVTPPGHWNRIAQGVSRDRRLTLEENARLFALLNVALADAGIACWDCKFKYEFWRPVQAIRESDPRWTPLLETPPFPAYSSGHSTFSGAAAAVLAMFFGTDAVRFCSTSDDLPGVTRSYTSFSAAAAEAGQSRIYGGIHWQFDNVEGLHCGREVGEYVCKYFLRPRQLPSREAPPDVRLLPPEAVLRPSGASGRSFPSGFRPMTSRERR